MIQTSSGKMCVLCGADCSAKPRVRDSHDNYYCKTCHQAALDGSKARLPAASSAPVAIRSLDECHEIPSPVADYHDGLAIDDSHDAFVPIDDDEYEKAEAPPSQPRAAEVERPESPVRRAAIEDDDDDELLLLEEDDD